MHSLLFKVDVQIVLPDRDKNVLVICEIFDSLLFAVPIVFELLKCYSHINLCMNLCCILLFEIQFFLASSPSIKKLAVKTINLLVHQ